MPTLIGTMLVVLVKPTVLAFVSYFYWGANLLRSLQGRIVPYLHKDLLIWHYKMCKVGEFWLPVQKFLLFPYGLPNIPCLFLFVVIAACSFIFIPLSFHFLCKHRVFCIHILLSFSMQLCNCFWWTFSD